MQNTPSRELFDDWNEEKYRLHNKELKKELYIVRRDIRYARIWINIGMEENGKEDFRRPVLVINRIGGLFFVVPLSTKEKDNKFYYRLTSVDFKKPSLVILSQARVIDKRRFMDKIGEVSDEEFQKIKKLLRRMYLPRN